MLAQCLYIVCCCDVSTFENTDNILNVLLSEHVFGLFYCELSFSKIVEALVSSHQ